MAQRNLRIGLLGAIVLSLLVSTPVAVAQKGTPATSTPWREQAQKLNLSEAAIERLARDRVLMTSEHFKQVFTPYLKSDCSVFITSDSLINTFHVLFEESFVQLEKVQAGRLQRLLAALADQLQKVDADLDGDQALIARAKRRATIHIAIARTLLGDEPKQLPAETDAVVRAEVARITAAKGISKPAWLGKPDPGFLAIDYGRFKVRGFYTRTPQLQRYFRAVSWLQAIPLRVHKDEELLSALMLGSAFGRLRWVGKKAERNQLNALLETYTEIIGTGDDWDLRSARRLAAAHSNCVLEFWVGPAAIARERERALQLAHGKRFGPLINDEIRWSTPEGPAASEIGYRVLSAHRTPGGLLFQRTTDQRDPKLRGRTLPTGLEIGALLGSQAARSALADSPRALALVDETQFLLEGKSLLAEYLRCMQALVDEPEPDAPAFMAGKPWRVKQLNTVLAGWAQIRHTFVLQAKQSFTVWSADKRPVGFVEPEPEFYGRFGQFASRTKELLKKVGAIGVLATETTEAEARRRTSLRIDFELAWDVLRELCQRLEVLAHKQLRGVPFNKNERDFVLAYGKQIAVLQFHFGNSCKMPRDDAPRIADVHADPAGGKVLLVGVARPRALWVLYPWRGKDVLCRGAVMPYREFASPTRLTDEEWKELLDSKERPSSPAWIAPLAARSPQAK